LFLGGDAQLGLAVVAEALFEEREHLAGRLARGADDEDEAEPLLVFAVAGGERRARLRGRVARARLLALRPRARLRAHRGRGLPLADLRVRAEGFEPVVR
jgi:hypothetical protein